FHPFDWRRTHRGVGGALARSLDGPVPGHTRPKADVLSDPRNQKIAEIRIARTCNFQARKMIRSRGWLFRAGPLHSRYHISPPNSDRRPLRGWSRLDSRSTPA